MAILIKIFTSLSSIGSFFALPSNTWFQWFLNCSHNESEEGVSRKSIFGLLADGSQKSADKSDAVISLCSIMSRGEMEAYITVNHTITFFFYSISTKVHAYMRMP